MLMTVGIGIYGVLTSYLAHFFLPRSSDHSESSDPAGTSELDGIRANLDGIGNELDAVNRRLDAIQAVLVDLAPPPGDAGMEPD